MSDFRPDIWRLQAQFNTEGLVQALESDDPGIRRRAAAALRALGAFDAIPALQRALEGEKDTEARANIVSALAALQHEQERRIGVEPDESSTTSEIDRYIAQLKSDDEENIIKAAHVLGDKGDKTAVPALVLLFNDPNISIKVRLAVAEALLKLESAPVEVALLGALRSNEWRVRRNSAAILGQLKANWAIDPLAKTLYDENELVRKTAYSALRHIGTPEAREALDAVRREAQRRREAKGQAQENGNKPDAHHDDKDNPTADVEDVFQLEPDALEPDAIDPDKIKWPSKRKEPLDPKLAPTKPFDPAAIERAREQLERMQQENDNRSDND